MANIDNVIDSKTDANDIYSDRLSALIIRSLNIKDIAPISNSDIITMDHHICITYVGVLFVSLFCLSGFIMMSHCFSECPKNFFY